MPDLSEAEESRRRRNAAAHLAVGGTMIGGAAAARQHLAEKTGFQGPIKEAKAVARTGKLLPKHGKYGAGWVATRGVAAAGVPLAAIGAKNVLAPKPKKVEGLDVGNDVVAETIDRTAVGAPNIKRSKVSRKSEAARLATIGAGTTAGGFVGSAIGRRAPKKYRLAAVGLGATAGVTGGALAASPFSHRAVRHVSRDKYDYSVERGVYRRGTVQKADLAQPVILPKKEQTAQVHRKHKAANLSLASAGLGVTALGLRAPALVKWGAERSTKLARAPGVKRIVQAEKKATPASWNVGVAGTGVGSAAALNAYRIQQTENRALDRQVKKMHYMDLAKAQVSHEEIRSRRFMGDGGLKIRPNSAALEYGRDVANRRGDAALARANRLIELRNRMVTGTGREAATRGKPGRHLDEADRQGMIEARLHGEQQRRTSTRVRPNSRAVDIVNEIDAARTARQASAKQPPLKDMPKASAPPPKASAPPPPKAPPTAKAPAPKAAPSMPRPVQASIPHPVQPRASTPAKVARKMRFGTKAKVLTGVGAGAGLLGLSQMNKADAKLHLHGDRDRSEDVAKAIIPTRMFRPKPMRFGGVRAGGLRRVQTATGLKTIAYRGSMG